MSRGSRRKMTKKTSQLFHARLKCKDRYGFKLTNEIYSDIIDQILTRNADLISKQSNRVYIFDVSLNGNKVRVVYDDIRVSLVTFLKPDWTGVLDLPKNN